MKSISDPFLRRPVLTLVVSLLVLLAGLVSLPVLQVENLPPIAPGRVTVRATYPGAGPEVVEQGVTARELECAVLGNRQLKASVLGEIRFEADWYDYTTKYSEGLSHTVIPAEVPASLAERARQLAIAACRAVGAAGLARVDFFYGEATGQLWLNEINTLPGFTSQSMYPMLWEASGVPLEELVHQLVELAQESGQPCATSAEAA
jgi:D-alanine-D-alanine ligase